MLSPPADRAYARTWTPAANGTTADAPAALPPGRPHAGSDAGFKATLSVAAGLLDCPCVMLWAIEDRRPRLVGSRGLSPVTAAAAAGSALATSVSPDRRLVVFTDLRANPSLAGDGLVSGEEGLRFFAAVLLTGPAGEPVGVLGVGDRSPREATRDLTDRLDALSRLAARVFAGDVLARCRQVAEAGFSAVIMADHHGTTLFANAAARELLGSVASPGESLEQLVPAALQVDPEAVSAWLHAPPVTSGHMRTTRELRIRDAQGELRTVQAARTDWSDGSLRGVVLVMRETVESGLRREPRPARRDALTGLPNREALYATIDSLRAHGVHLGVALLGLDNFRAINEALGHVIGDTVLQVVASRLMAWLPANAHLARFGGDEFVILFPSVDASERLEVRLEALLAEISRPCEIEHQRVHVEACIGLAFDGQDDDGALAYHDAGSSGLLALAALALRHAKRHGSMRVRHFSPTMREEALDRRQLDLELRRALRDGEFELHYQPQIDLTTGSPSGAEALLRWRHPERGLLMPGAFIDALARSPIAAQVGTWILRQACRDAAGWPLVNGQGLKVGVNLFPAQFNDEALVARIDAALADSGLPPERLEIELTETIALRDDGVAERTLLQLRRRGIRVSYDDFGTGHASLSMLHRLPVDRVKIDRSFVRDLVGSRGDKAIVRSITLIARNFDMEVIAEGVETPDQAMLLREFGCHEVQGFLYSQALAQQVFQCWLQRHPQTRQNLASDASMEHGNA